MSQVIQTFGPGAMVDLPERSIIVGGLDTWQGPRRRIFEERLEARLAELLKVQSVSLYEPPIELGLSEGDPKTGIDAFVFPRWFLGAINREFEGYRTRPLLRWDQLVKGEYLGDDRRRYPVVPVRFVQACVKGHISDIDWYAFVREDPHDKTGPLWLDEAGGGNDFSEIYVRCEKSGRRRALAQAVIPELRALGICRGRKPWLGPEIWEKCDQPNKLLTRSASNAYFSQVMSAISIPDANAAVREAVDLVWDDYLQYLESADELPRERRKEKVKAALEGLSDNAVWAEIHRRKNPAPDASKSIKDAEIETLAAAPEGDGAADPGGDFYARAYKNVAIPHADRVVLVHRLREVMAQVGFTRFEASLPGIDGELDLGVQLAPLSRELNWLPATENRGEGVFISVSRSSIDAWLARSEVKAYATQLQRGFDVWKDRHQQSRMEFPGLPYMMLHSLSHLLITAVALDCGYSASAIRERIYAGEYGNGILLFTGSSGSEGTLGGLVEVGRNLHRHFTRALDMGRLCSNDPVCAQHDPSNVLEARFLHGAACHGCLLIAETCCERRNEFLDRALVVPTVDNSQAAFYQP